MHEKDHSIIERSNVQTDVVVVNQCDKDSVDEFDFKNKKGETCHAKFINTTERGLSRSRNMAIRNAWGDVCLICDDDEWLSDDYADTIIKAYKDKSTADFIAFACEREGHSYPLKWQKLGFVQILKTSSIQMTFILNTIRKKYIYFDVLMGSGTGNGAGEENKFMMRCRKENLKMYYCPSVITKLLTTNSLWNNGYNKEYFKNRGWSSRRILGTFWGYCFMWYNILGHRKQFISTEYSFCRVLFYFHKGFFENREISTKK